MVTEKDRFTPAHPGKKRNVPREVSWSRERASRYARAMGRVLGSALVAALVSAAVCCALHWFGALPAPSAEVPRVEGLAPEQARELLGGRELLLVLDGEL